MWFDALKIGAGRLSVSGAPDGLDRLKLAEMATAMPGKVIVHVARDDQRIAALEEAIGFFNPDLEVLRFPAWDCLPYDRVSPSAPIVARRLATLAQLLRRKPNGPLIVLTTVNAVIQRVMARDVLAQASLSIKPGQRVAMDDLQEHLSRNGFSRTGTVVDSGDFAVRGGIIDLFAPGSREPVRLDFFGDTLESIRSFDVETQRTSGQLKHLTLEPANEVLISDDSVARFRTGYAAEFGAAGPNDSLYETISAKRWYQGVEHWLALFYPQLETLFDYVGEAIISLDHMAEETLAARLELISDYYDSRFSAMSQDSFGAPPYKPLQPQALYLADDEWQQCLGAYAVVHWSPFEEAARAGAEVTSVGGRQGRNFAAERAAAGGNVYSAVKDYVDAQRRAKKRVVLASWSEGACERLEGILRDHGVTPVAVAKSWAEVEKRKADIVSLVVLGLESGFETDDLSVLSEQDILGDRLVRRSKKTRKAADFIAELSSLEAGDLVVHNDHGIGRFEGLKTVEVQGAPHDCLHLTYAGEARLFLPVENIDLLSRYGSEQAGVQLDKLGGGAWQARKSKLKEKVREIAAHLIKTAAARELRKGEIINLPEGAYDEFAARFAYEETEDQMNAIVAVLEDLASGRPMDRLICGDVGFGKTEVALRAAFVAVMAGKQVAIVVPTTLLARQHFATVQERFQGLPVRIEQVSRLVTPKFVEETRKGMADGAVDIVIGTHALLTENTKFRDIGILIIDEEQHFGVKHKERLKEMRANVHVLTLTATPIPRTLQLSLSGVRELSLITTPPIDRLAVRTFISPFDPVVIRENLLRELYRGGQSFYVVPRIADLGEIATFLAESVPEVKVAIAHGRMAPTELEDIMTGFYERKFDVLLATTIIESGLDIPTANTLIVHRADMFGLAQLYQIRGRVGRSKQRAYALFTVPANRVLTTGAEKRLKVLQSLDTLGAGFSLASHDLDIRGAGNLLGEEQSGHIREVGFELYQSMLEEAVANLRSGGLEDSDEEGSWSPVINIGTAVLIPENYVADLQVRLGLYRRLADLKLQNELDGFAAEIHDRFGRPPEEVQHLLEIMAIKLMCIAANVQTVDAGPKGAVIGLRAGKFAQPEALVDWITRQGTKAKLRPDMKIVAIRDWQTPEERLSGVRHIMREIVTLAN